MDNQVKCPKCGSTQITPVTLKDNSILITCLACGQQFKPGETVLGKNVEKVKPKMTKTGIGCTAVIVVALIIAVVNKSDDKTSPVAVTKAVPVNPADLINKVKHDSLYKVTKVEILEDSTMRITVSDPEKFGTDDYFNKTYNLLDGGLIQEIEIAKGNKILYNQGHHTDKIINAFKETNMIGDNCYTLNQAIEKSLNDPDSFSPVKSSYNYIGTNMFEVTSEYRAKNAFNATITRVAKAIITTDGRILKMEL